MDRCWGVVNHRPGHLHFLVEFVIDLLLVAAVGLLQVQLVRVRASAAKALARFEQTTRLYEKSRGDLNAHIKAPIHKR